MDGSVNWSELVEITTERSMNDIRFVGRNESKRWNGKSKQIVENVRVQNFLKTQCYWQQLWHPIRTILNCFQFVCFLGRLVCTPNLSRTRRSSLFSTTSFRKLNLNEFEAIGTQKIQQSIHSFTSMFLTTRYTEIVSPNRWFYTVNANRIGCFAVFGFVLIVVALD